MNCFDILPQFVTKYIFLFLDIKSLGKISQVSHTFRLVSELAADIIEKYLKIKVFHHNFFKVYNRPYRIRGFVAYTFDIEDNQKLWKRTSDLRRDRSYLTMVWLKGELYALGTYSYIASGTVEKYNSIANIWSSVDPLPRKIRCFSATVVDDLIYVFGGQDSWTSEVLRSIYVYRLLGPSSRRHGEWLLSKSHLPIAISGHTSVMYRNKIWVGGGCTDNTNPINKVYIWDYQSDQWVTGPHLNRQRKFFKLFVVSNRLYAVGGDETESHHSDVATESVTYIKATVEVFNDLTQSWEVVTTFPRIRKGYTSSVHKNFIYVFGGDLSSQCTWDRWNVLTNVWDTKADPNSTLNFNMPALSSHGDAVSFPPEDLKWTHVYGKDQFENCS